MQNVSIEMTRTVSIEMTRLVDDPDPAIDFGSKGEPWSFEVFELYATMIIERPTCHSAANMLEGILTKLFPKKLDAHVQKLLRYSG
jgi:hypothetical protein